MKANGGSHDFRAPSALAGFNATDATVGVPEIVRARVRVGAGLESATLKVRGVLATEAEGVAIVPGEAFRVKPAGREPLGQRPGVRQDDSGRGEAGAIGSTELTGGSEEVEILI